MGKKYKDYTESAPQSKFAVGRSGLMRKYTLISCPVCNRGFCDIVSEQVATSKASRIKKHIESEHTWTSLREAVPTEALEEEREVAEMHVLCAGNKRVNDAMKQQLAEYKNVFDFIANQLRLPSPLCLQSMPQAITDTFDRLDGLRRENVVLSEELGKHKRRRREAEETSRALLIEKAQRKRMFKILKMKPNICRYLAFVGHPDKALSAEMLEAKTWFKTMVEEE